MITVNYVQEVEAFISYASINGLSDHERALWLAVFHLANRQAQGSWWPEGFISVPNKILLSLVGFSEDVLPSVRNRLVQRGILDYRPGKKNLRSPAYALKYFYPQEIVDNPVDNSVDNSEAPICTDLNSGFNPVFTGKNYGKNTGKTSGKNAGKKSGIRINITETETRLNPLEEETGGAPVFNSAREGDPFACFGAERVRWMLRPTDQLTMARLEQLRNYPWFATMYGEDQPVIRALISHDRYPLELVEAAIRQTLTRHERGPLDRPSAYTIKILDDWVCHGIHSVAELEQHRQGYYDAHSDVREMVT